MRKPSQHPKIKAALLIALLAVLCIGGAELIAGYFFAPDWFHRTTAPIRHGADAAAAFCRDTVSELWTTMSDLSRQLAARLEPESTADTELPDTAQMADTPLYEARGPILDPSITELALREGEVVLTGGNAEIPYFNQAEEPWASQSYGSDTIGRYGCGPVAMAMVVNSLTDQNTDPARMAQWAVENHYWAKQSGSYHAIVEGTARAFGLSARSIANKSPAGLRDALLAGDIVVALMGPGHFTQSGHFILIHGITLSGTVLVADPNSTQRSLMEWEPELIIRELSASTDSGAPLWSISRG